MPIVYRRIFVAFPTIYKNTVGLLLLIHQIRENLVAFTVGLRAGGLG